MTKTFTIGKWLIEKTSISKDKSAFSVYDQSVEQLGTTDWLREMWTNNDYIVPETTPDELQEKWDAWASTTALMYQQKWAMAGRLARRVVRERYKALGLKQ